MKRSKFFNAARVNRIMEEDERFQRVRERRSGPYVFASFFDFAGESFILVEGLTDADDADGTLQEVTGALRDWGYESVVLPNSWHRQVRLTSYTPSKGGLLLEKEREAADNPRVRSSCNPSRIRRELEAAGIPCVTRRRMDGEVEVRNIDFASERITQAVRVLEALGFSVEVVDNAPSVMNPKVLHVSEKKARF